MGLDFLRKTAKEHTKAWNAEFQRGAEDLFAPTCSTIHRSFLASVVAQGTLHEGDEVAIRLHNDRVMVLKDLFPLAVIDKPSLDLVETLNACFGVLHGVVDETNDLADTVSVFIGDKEATRA